MQIDWDPLLEIIENSTMATVDTVNQTVCTSIPSWAFWSVGVGLNSITVVMLSAIVGLIWTRMYRM